MRQEERDLVLRRQRDVCICLLSRALSLSAVQMQPSSEVQSVHQHERVSELLGQGKGVLDAH